MKKYLLADYIEKLQGLGLLAGELPAQEILSREVELVSCSSQDVIPGTLFLVKGAHFKAEYLADAAARGAFCYMAEQPFDEVELPFIALTDVRKAMAALATFYYNDPSKQTNVIGITGTKGKSSTTYFIKSILDAYEKGIGGNETGVCGSIDTYDGTERFESHLTTPEPLDLERHLHHCVENEIEYMTMEVSSQALKYDRVSGVDFKVGCFLNIGYDHVSPVEHPDWEDYFASKLLIFKQCETAVVNLDSDHAERILAEAKAAKRVITFSEMDESADVYGYDVHKEEELTVFKVRTKNFNREFKLSIPGLFNVQNALCAIAVCLNFNIGEQYIYAGLLKARVPGRMEIYTNADRHVIAIVDYAHNRLSFEKLFESVKSEYPGRRIVIVFGCPGKKAYDRRHDLGEIAGKYSDHVYLCEEDPGEEDATEICKEIAVAVAEQGCTYSIDPDRGRSIHAAVMDSVEETVILITGKGAETREKRGIEYIPVPSDVDYAKEALHAYDVAHHMDGMSQVLGLLETLPKLNALENNIIVIKYGGSALEGSGVIDTILEDVAALRMAGAKVVLVHGGGKNISGWLDKLGVESRFEKGYRVTDDLTMQVTEMALSGQVNKRIVKALHQLKVKGVGISGRDGDLLVCHEKKIDGVDIGHVGSIDHVNTDLIHTLLAAGYVPVISPIGTDVDGNPYNINADDAACAIAQELAADKLVYITDVNGILMDKDNHKTLMERLSVSQAEELLSAGMIAGGMVPKLNSCIDAIHAGVKRVVILDGRVEHTVLLEAVSSQMMGTVIYGEEV